MTPRTIPLQYIAFGDREINPARLHDRLLWSVLPTAAGIVCTSHVITHDEAIDIQRWADVRGTVEEYPQPDVHPTNERAGTFATEAEAITFLAGDDARLRWHAGRVFYHLKHGKYPTDRYPPDVEFLTKFEKVQ